MIKRIVGWLMATLPPNALKILFVGAILTWTLEWGFYTMLQLEYGQLPDDLQRLGLPRVWLLSCLAGWAAWRTYSINPVCQPRYLEWLQTTPWTPGKSLPLGRIELATQDALWLVAATVAFWHWPNSLFVPLAFLVPYAAALSFINYATKQYLAVGAAVGLLFMLPLLAMSTQQPLLVLGDALLATLAAEWGWRRTLRDYPWDAVPTSRFQYNALQKQEADATCAWWPLVHPWRGTAITPLISWRDSLLLAGFCSWLAATATMSIDWMEFYEAARFNRPVVDVTRATLPLVAGCVGFVVATMRLYRYAIWCAWPLSLRGRFRTGRFVIPGYDQVFIAPVAAFAASLIIPNILLSLGTPTIATASLTTFAVVAAAVGTGPTLAAWSLTGEYRMMLHTPADRHRARRGTAT